MKNSSWVLFIVFIAVILGIIGYTVGKKTEKLINEKEPITFVERTEEEEVVIEEKEDLAGDVELEDEPVALGFSDDQERELIYFIDKTGEQIEEILYVVIPNTKIYGSTLGFETSQFYLDKEELCYGVLIKNDKVLDIKIPIAYTDLTDIIGEPILQDDYLKYYEYQDYILAIEKEALVVDKVFIGKDFSSALMYTLNNDEHFTNDIYRLSNYSKDEAYVLLGEFETTEDGNLNIHYFPEDHIYIWYDTSGNVISVITEDKGAFGLAIGQELDDVLSHYVTPIDLEKTEESEIYTFNVEGYKFKATFIESKIVKIEFIAN